MKYKLSENDISMLERVSDKTGVSTGIEDEEWIEVDLLLETISELEDLYDDAMEDIDDYKENYRPIGNESGWDLARCYQNELEHQRDFLEEKGLLEEYKDWKKSGFGKKAKKGIGK